MTYIEAAEDSFGKANNFYILMWIVTALIVVTALVDFRSYRLEEKSNDKTIEFYSGLERNASKIALEIRSFVYLKPNFSTEKQAIDELRRHRSALFAKLRQVVKTMALPATDLTTDERIAINGSLNTLGAFLLLNDLTGYDSEFPFLDDHAALRLAEHSPGSYLVAGKIENLRFEDAIRYHWLTTMEMESWLTSLDAFEIAIGSKADLDKHISEMTRLKELMLHEFNIEKRAFAEQVWNDWIKSPRSPIPELESRRRSNLTLAQTSEILGQAFDRKVQLSLRATGRTSTVEIPVLSVPLQMRDAILVGPLILAFCSLAISIYTLRALRYAEKVTVIDEVIGNVPSYYAFYGFWKHPRTVVTVTLLTIPSLTFLVLLPFFVPVLLEQWDLEAVVYFAGATVALLLQAVPLSQISNVTELIEGGVLIKPRVSAVRAKGSN